MFEYALRLYRKTLKRLKPVHIILHRVMTHGLIPLLERLKAFKTMPDDPFWFRLELLLGRHEVETIRQVDRLVQPGMTVLDIGAHVGYYARRFSGRVGRDGRVIAFEPHPRTFAVLCDNTARFPNVTPVQVAAAEDEGSAELYDYLMMSASGSLHYDESMRDLQKSQLANTDIAPRIAADFPVERFTVRTTPIDRCLAELDIAGVDFIKMDIEGAELRALRGMRETISRSPRLSLVMEYNPQALSTSGFEPQQALLEVLAMGFSRVHIIESDGTLTELTQDTRRLADLTQNLMTHMGVANLLFTRQPPDKPV